MKKLLGLLAVAPIMATACTTTETVEKIVINTTGTFAKVTTYGGTMAEDYSSNIFNAENVGTIESWQYSHGLEIATNDVIALSVEGVDLTATNFEDNIALAFNESSYCSAPASDWTKPETTAGLTVDGDVLKSNAFMQSISAADTLYADSAAWLADISDTTKEFLKGCNDVDDAGLAAMFDNGGFIARDIPAGDIEISFYEGMAFYKIAGSDYSMNYNALTTKGDDAVQLTPSLLINASSVAETFKTKWETGKTITGEYTA